MANNSTIDGLGFEEVNQASATEIISGTNVYGIVGSFGTIRNTNYVGTGSISTGSVSVTEGRLRSTVLGSATTSVYGGIVQAGSFDTSAGSIGFIAFGIPYSTASSYYVNATATGSIAGYEESYISGARHTSGVNFVGAASLRYDWIAVGR